MKLHNLLKILSFTFFLYSCNTQNSDVQDKKIPETIQEQKEEATHLDILKNKTIDVDLDENMPLDEIEEQLFGKFFDERAEFFVIEEPHKTILNAKVKKLTLIFLDGKLSKLKYILDANISNELLNNYGKCKITGLDPENKYLMKNKDIIIKEKDKYLLSENLNNYQIQWDLGERSLLMRVLTIKDEKLYEYEEKIKDYEKYFKYLEYNNISL
ncbi:MAG: hypothetical protein M3421_13930 [Bacteroidota bacterium]|nr:hypothetical protein [Bacteroidota bacterium]